MTVLEMILLALGVSVDAFSVSVSRSMICHKKVWKNAASAAFFFGGFQFVMPMIGGWISSFIGPFLYSVDHYIAFILLALVGGKMIWESIHVEDQTELTESEENPFGLMPPQNLLHKHYLSDVLPNEVPCHFHQTILDIHNILLYSTVHFVE